MGETVTGDFDDSFSPFRPFSVSPIQSVISLITILFLLSSCTQKSRHDQTSPQPQIESEPGSVDQIILANGGSIQGKVIEESPEIVRIEISDGIVGFHPSEIRAIERGRSKKQGASEDVVVPTFGEEELAPGWPKGVDHRVRLKRGEWVNGRIVRKSEQALTVRQQLEGGGRVELDLAMGNVERIELWPPPDSNQLERLADFRQAYPSLHQIERGYFTILTSEQDPTDLNFYVKKLDQFYHDFLIHFFDLIDPAQPHEPLDVVIFGTREEFESALKEIGYNEKTNLIGFYHFDAKKLVFYNVRTDAYIQAGLQQNRELQSMVNRLGSSVRANSGEPVHGISGGVIDMASDELEREELRILGEASSQNVNIIRHEGGHQLFHLLGITPIEVYSGGWLVEGLATYSEPEPIGGIHGEKLMELRYELERNELMPLAYLLNFSAGLSFHKLDPAYAALAYAESWAFIYFLIHEGYQMPFFNYLKEMRTQGKEYDSASEKKLLEKYLGKSLNEIETEFFPFTKKLIAESVDEKAYEEYRLRLVTAH